jgi:hypothetical protein
VSSDPGRSWPGGGVNGAAWVQRARRSYPRDLWEPAFDESDSRCERRSDGSNPGIARMHLEKT